MTLPESIPVRYTEEEAGYVTVRPVVRQTFRLTELLDMILSVTTKDVGRVRQILKSGTVVYHFYRYWWNGFDADPAELSAVLGQFPDPDPSRPFSSADCVKAIFETGGVNPKPLLELDRANGSRRGFLRRHSFWEELLEVAAAAKPAYRGYSYADRADIYALPLTAERSLQLAQSAKHAASRSVKSAWRTLPDAAQILLICPRQSPGLAGKL